MKAIKVGFIGNPNCGKTTLFNAFTGANLKVANWPGVTVEKKEGRTSYDGQDIVLIDLPGIYSLTSYSIEEKVSRKCLMEDDVDVIVNVVDASSLERNLYLTMQLLELGKPVVLALNMMDIVLERGMEIDLHRLPEMLGGIPVVPVSARKRTGLDVLLHAVVHHYEEKSNHDILKYDEAIEEKIELVSARIISSYGVIKNLRWTAIKLLEQDEVVVEQFPISVSDIVDPKDVKTIINKKYEYIEEVVEECLFNKNKKAASTDKIDRLLTHNIWGIPCFLVIMAVVFFFTFTIGDAIKGVFEVILEDLTTNASSFFESIHIYPWLNSLICDGILAGVGGILTFLPNIFILFLALAFLEDSGYMSRVAYVMDGIMSKFGVSGKGFLPMILGFGCTVPAVMATRALEREKDRRRIMLITPFMSCSARLPIYVFFSELFFEENAMIVCYSMYILGVVIALLIAIITHLFDKDKSSQALLIELPEYKSPNARTIAIYVGEKVKDYLTKAGTTILIASVIVWFILNFNTSGLTTDVSTSFGSSIGRFLVPILAPAGLGMWQLAVALIAGISAKEVVVTCMMVLFGVGNQTTTGMSELFANYGFGAANALAMMVFCLLYIPCIATIATIKNESKSWAFTVKVIIFQLVLAWIMAFLTYHLFVGIL